jgi:thymidylate synthase
LIWKNRSHGNPRYESGTGRPHAANAHTMRTPWDWAKQSLIADRDTRQALLRFSLPEHQWIGNKDQTCTLHGLFLIRDNKLNLTITMRSNDLTLGLVYDLPWFVGLLHRMKDELQETYPGLGVGTYTHYVHSLHIYDRDQEKILKMLGRK